MCPLYYAQNLLGTEGYLPYGTPVWPLGILFCSSGSDKKLPTYNRGRGWPGKMRLGDIVEECKCKLLPERSLEVHALF